MISSNGIRTVAIGAPFVGAVAAALVIAELVRLANGAHTYDFMDCHLRALEKRTIALPIDSLLVNLGTPMPESTAK